MKRLAFTLIELLAVIAIVGAVAGLAATGIQRARARADAGSCLNNMRQLGLALHQYHDANRHLPRGACDDPTAVDDGIGWHGPVLPYIEHDALWQQCLQFIQDGYSVVNDRFPGSQLTIPAFLCASDPRSRIIRRTVMGGRSSYSNYLGVAGRSVVKQEHDEETPQGVLYRNSQIAFAEITDGTSNTLMLGERPILFYVPQLGNSYPWYLGIGPGNATMGVEEGFMSEWRQQIDHPNNPCPNGIRYQDRQGNVCDVYRYWSFHSSGSHFAKCDGSVVFLKYSAQPVIIPLSTRAGGDESVWE